MGKERDLEKVRQGKRDFGKASIVTAS